MRNSLLLSILVGVSAAVLARRALADDKHPCEQIKKACEAAGFVKGQAKEGTGLWVDCIDPIIQGKAQPAKAKKPLPSVDASLVGECKTKHPNWGEGHHKK